MRAREEAARGVGPPQATSRGVGQSPTKVNGAHMRAREEAARGVGPPQATSRGVGQSPT